jgi:hypothetical protein
MTFGNIRERDISLNMAALLISQRRAEKRMEKFLTLLFVGTMFEFIGAWGLMLLVPLAHEQLGTPDTHPGYWACMGILLLVGLVRMPFHTSESTKD